MSPKTTDAVETRAIDFLLRQRFWSWSAREDEELAAWLDESVNHRVAYLRLQAGAERVERLAALRPPKPMRPSDSGGRSLWEQIRPILTVAAAILLVTTLGLALARYLLTPSDRAFATDVGGRATLKFPDGTEMALNTDTAVRYRMTTAERIVWLDRGEAYFTVAHDASHPFSVVAGGSRITDLGTEFLVRSDTNHLEVALLKGRAQFGSDDGRTRSATLTPGEDVIATPASLTIARKSTQQLADAIAWQRGVLVFRHTPLYEAARQFNRYNRTKLVISDPNVAALRIGGEFKTDNVDEFLKLAQAVLKLHVGRFGNEIVISRNDGGGVKRGH